MSVISDLPIRENGRTFFASWVNDIRTALIAMFGSGLVIETQFTIADNQGSYTNVTGLLLDQSVIRAAQIDYTIYRTNGAGTERREIGSLICLYKAVAGTWTYERVSHGDDSLNVADSLIVTSAGQVQYKSDSVGATYVGKMRYKILTAFNKET